MSSVATDRSVAIGDVIQLVKPRITLFALITTAGGASLAPGGLGQIPWLALLIGTALIVGSANTLNMYLERDTDCLMVRTRNRPLPAGRMEPLFALGFGILLGALALPILVGGVNWLCGVLGAIAFVSYVFMYTPMKRRSTLALLVGSIPGAMPALMGWTAATGGLEVGGLAVFGILFIWQIPHFHAIALFRKHDYGNAGLKTVPVNGSNSLARRSILIWLAAQIQMSLMLYPLGVAGITYLAIASVLGLAYFGYALFGLKEGNAKWARSLFFISIIYLPLLFAAMVFDGIS